MRSVLAQSIRSARLAVGLTQKQLGMRLGLKGRAVYRWEQDHSAPKKRYRDALVAVIRAVNPKAAEQLLDVFKLGAKGAVSPAMPVAAAPALAPLSERAAVELALFRTADELDLPLRRVRGPVLRLLERLRAGNLTLEATQEHVKRWIAETQ